MTCNYIYIGVYEMREEVGILKKENLGRVLCANLKKEEENFLNNN